MATHETILTSLKVSRNPPYPVTTQQPQTLSFTSAYQVSSPLSSLSEYTCILKLTLSCPSSTVRTTRARIIRLKNDYKSLMSKIEEALHTRHAEYQALQQQQQSTAHTSTSNPGDSSSSSSSLGQTALTDTTLQATPFAVINTIAPNSPAEEAGLRPGDKVRTFGNVNWMNHEKLSRLADVVKRNEGRRVEVRVIRQIEGAPPSDSRREVTVALVPRSGWGGRGMLGCHLLPL